MKIYLRIENKNRNFLENLKFVIFFLENLKKIDLVLNISTLKIKDNNFLKISNF